MISLPGYEIFNQIHESNNSLVYRGLQKSERQLVIFKVLKHEYPTPEKITRYKQEYEITKSLKIDGVAKAYSLEKFQNTLVIVLEDFGGESLKTLMSSLNFNLIEILKIAIKITQILTEIHAANIIHKDISPANIIFNHTTNIVKIIDFGTSTVLYRENPTIKNPQVIEGTLAYISPEQTGRMNRCLDYRTDFYSLGVTFYELLTNQLPFDTTDAMELVHSHIAKQPVSPHQLNPEIPQAVSDIVMKLLAKTAEERYQSAWGIAADLRECLTQLETSGQIDDFVLAKQDISDKFYIPQKLYGREREVEILLTAFDRVASPQKNRVSVGSAEMMLVSGYSGIGKSALVQEIYKPITRDRGYFISGKFDQFQRNIPYSAIANAFQSLARQLLTENEATLLQWKEKLQSALGINGQIIIDVVPEIELIIGCQPAVQKLNPTESQNRFNLVFQNFIRVFCSISHPLVIFLDDLQWADAATLKLIEIIMTDEEMSYLFLIGAYRDNEVDSTHPLMMAMNALRYNKAIINHINLLPLKLGHISQLIAETLHTDIESVAPLAHLIVGKTQGNPFFVNQFLKTLYAEKLLQFNPPKSDSQIAPQLWHWDIAHIEAMDITENVVELMINRLKKLPKLTQLVLQLAACAGNKFDLNTLAIIYEESAAETFADLLPAIQAGLILPTSEFKITSLEVDNSHIVIDTYKFLHDRVQQSAYSLIEEKLQKSVHLQIGQLLLENISLEEQEDRIFEIVDHLNLGLVLLVEEKSIIELATLNLSAARKAKDAMAYAAAREYLIVAMASLPSDIWTKNYYLALNIYQERAEVEYLNGNFEDSENLINLILSQEISPIEKAEVYNMLIVQYTLLTKYEQAIAAGRKALALLDINLPENVLELQIAVAIELAEAKTKWENIEIPALINQEKMQISAQKTAMKLFSNMGALTFFSSQDLWKLTVVKAMNLSFKYGFVAGGSYCYSCYGIILGSILGDYNSAYQFGLLSLKLSEISNNLAQNCQDSVIFANYLNCWIHHIKTTAYINYEGYKIGLQSGNLQWTGYNRMFQTITLFYQGVNLVLLSEEIDTFILFCQKTKNQWATDIVLANKIAVINLMDKNNSLNEVEYLESFHEHKSMAGICEYHVLKAQTFYIYEQYDQAIKWAVSALENINYILGHISSSHHNFYYSLILTAIYSDASEIDQKHYLEVLLVNQKQLQVWANQCPENFLHKYLLVEAEIARISGKVVEAMELYDRAIESARQHEFIQNEALANELAAKFWLAKGKEEFAKIYLTKAHYGYQLWGAFGKVKDLETKYSQLVSKVSNRKTIDSQITATANSTMESGNNALDLTTVIKASQAISSEIVLSSLLNKLMKIVIENAGAQLGLFITKQDDIWKIEVEGTVGIDNTTILHSKNFLNNQIPLSIINYVERTRYNLVIDEATSEVRFLNDPYILSEQPKSILCSPIIYQGKFIGILYLENNLTTKAFTPERLKILNLLTAQVAISLENARLYSDLQVYSEELNRKNITLLETNTKLADEIIERQQAEKLLRESQEFLQAVINNSNAAIYVKDAQLRYILINRKSESILNIDSETIKGKTDYDLLPKEIVDILYVNDQKVLAGTPLELEEVVAQTDGLHTYLSIKVPLFDGNGKIYAMCGISTDITDRKRVEEQIRQFNEILETQVAQRTAQLEVANKELDSFSYSVSHDLRAPLRHVGGFVNALEQHLQRTGAIADPKITHYINIIRSSSEKMANLIDGLLTLSRVGRRELEKRPVNLMTLVEDAIDLVQSQPAVTRRSIEFIVNPLPILPGDATLLQQVFTNLIHNAVKFTRDRSPARITVGIVDQRTIFVKDNGVGFDMEYGDQLFGAFQRLHSDKKFEGTGIGLAIVQRIIHKHGGEVWAESELNVGTTFYFTLD